VFATDSWLTWKERKTLSPDQECMLARDNSKSKVYFIKLFLQVFGVLLTFLQVGQSEKMLRHVFASLRSFIHKVML
jgi:hypothetical protein